MTADGEQGSTRLGPQNLNDLDANTSRNRST